MDHNGTVPVEGNKCPCQWARDNWNMNKAWEDLMTEVKRGEVKEVDNQNDFSPGSVAANEEHYESKL